MYFNSLPVEPLRITSKFGPRNTGIEGASTYHKGIDLGGNGVNTPIYAVRYGVVSWNYWNNTRGWVVVIQHNGEYSTLYQHLKERSPLKAGTIVYSGQQIGIMGNSSKTIKCGVHLHMELHKNGKPIDPEPYLKNIKGVEEDMNEKELRSLVKAEVLSILSGKDTEVSAWATEAWEKAKKSGVTDGSNPKGYPTREQVIVMLDRANGGK